MVHPFKTYNKDKEIESMEKISATLQICTLLNGLPHGLAFIAYTDLDSIKESFRGLGWFDHGKLHNTSFTCYISKGFGY